MKKELRLNTEKLAKLLNERVVDSSCPFCKCDDWALPLPAYATGVSLPWGKGSTYFMNGTPAAMLQCKHCGFIRLHSLSVLEGALEEVMVIEVGSGAPEA